MSEKSRRELKALGVVDGTSALPQPLLEELRDKFEQARELLTACAREALDDDPEEARIFVRSLNQLTAAVAGGDEPPPDDTPDGEGATVDETMVAQFATNCPLPEATKQTLVVGVGGIGRRLLQVFQDNLSASVWDESPLGETDVTCLYLDSWHEMFVEPDSVKISRRLVSEFERSDEVDLRHPDLEEIASRLSSSILDAENLVILGSLGGATGRVLSLLVAQMARDLRVKTCMIALNVFSFESDVRRKKADLARDRISALVDTTVLLENDCLFDQGKGILRILGNEAITIQMFRHLLDAIFVNGVSSVFRQHSFIRCYFVTGTLWKEVLFRTAEYITKTAEALSPIDTILVSASAGRALLPDSVMAGYRDLLHKHHLPCEVHIRADVENPYAGIELALLTGGQRPTGLDDAGDVESGEEVHLPRSPYQALLDEISGIDTFERHVAERQHADIRVVGVGESGLRVVEWMLKVGVKDVRFIVLNGNKRELAETKELSYLQIEHENIEGLLNRGNPSVWQRAAEKDSDGFRRLLFGADMVFVTTELGGGAGSGVSPVIARIARELGALTIGVVTRPFAFEDGTRQDNAARAIEQLADSVDTLIAVSSDRLLQPDNSAMAKEDTFGLADEVLCHGIRSISELLTLPGVIELSLDDLKPVFMRGGTATMSYGRAAGPNRATEAARQAIHSALLEDSIAEARAIVLSLKGGNDLELTEVHEAVSFIRETVPSWCKLVVGAIADAGLGEELQLTMVAVGANQVTPEEQSRHGDRHAPVSLETRMPVWLSGWQDAFLAESRAQLRVTDEVDDQPIVHMWPRQLRQLDERHWGC